MVCSPPFVLSFDGSVLAFGRFVVLGFDDAGDDREDEESGR